MKIEYNKVIWYLILLAIIFYVGTFILAFFLSQRYEADQILKIKQSLETNNVINSVIFTCDSSKTINAIFFKDKVELGLSDGRNMLLLQAISASGARYANTDESFVFWNKGDTAFVQEGNNTTYENCVIKK